MISLCIGYRELEDIPRQSAEFMMPSFEPLVYMRALDLEAMSALEFRECLFLYTHTLRGPMTDGELHVGMQF